MKLRRTCQEVAHLVLESEDRAIPPFDSVVMRLHWLACVNCRRFRDQQKLMRVALDRWKTYRDND